MPSTDTIGDLKTTALLAGFDPTLSEHELTVLGISVALDTRLLALVEKHCEIEARSPKPSHADFVLYDTLRAMDEKDKAALRFRVRYAVREGILA